MNNIGKINIDIKQVIITLLKHKKQFLKIWIITFALSCLWILPQPRYYTCTVLLAPESSTPMSQGGLSSIASSFGFNVGGLGEDAIYPTLYPDLFESTEFIVSLFNIQVESKDSTIQCDYYTYLAKHQKKNWLTFPYYYTVDKIKDLFTDDTKEKKGDGTNANPFKLSKFDTEIVSSISNNIMCSVDKKTEVVTIVVTDQDPLICATIADSVRERLQEFITDYRTRKVRIDIKHYQEVTDSAYQTYRDAVRKYSAYCDSHMNSNLQSVGSKREELENDMQLKFSTYSTLNTRLEASKVKLQERTPAFTTLRNATVPIKPAGPKRMIFVGFMLVMATFIYSALLIKRNSKSIIC